MAKIRTYAKICLILGIPGLLVLLCLSAWFSEENRFIRFTKEFGVEVDSGFTSDFVSTEDLSRYLQARGYEDPFRYFEETMEMRPGGERLSDPAISPSNRDLLISKGADELTVYRIERGFFIGIVERRVIIYQNNGVIIEMTSRTFDTGL